jgi:hypothetical protein
MVVRGLRLLPALPRRCGLVHACVREGALAVRFSPRACTLCYARTRPNGYLAHKPQALPEILRPYADKGAVWVHEHSSKMFGPGFIEAHRLGLVEAIDLRLVKKFETVKAFYISLHTMRTKGGVHLKRLAAIYDLLAAALGNPSISAGAVRFYIHRRVHRAARACQHD